MKLSGLIVLMVIQLFGLPAKSRYIRQAGCSVSKNSLEENVKIEFRVSNLWYDLMPTVDRKSKIYSEMNLSLINTSNEKINFLSIDNFRIWDEQGRISFPLVVQQTNSLFNLSFEPTETKMFFLRGEATPQTSQYLLNTEKIFITFDVREENKLGFIYTSSKIRIERVY